MEWVISSYEVDKLCSEQPFTCPACSPKMLAVSVDGNRKHYRFKKDGWSVYILYVSLSKYVHVSTLICYTRVQVLVLKQCKLIFQMIAIVLAIHIAMYVL